MQNKTRTNQAAQKEINEKAKKIGYKAANLEILSQIVPVPPFISLEHENILHYLDQHANSWRTLWDKFKQTQQSSANLTADAKHIIRDIQQLIKTTFINHPMHSDAIATFIKQAKNNSLIIRSTGKEDSVEVANPGGNESIAAVLPNSSAISKAIGEVIASYFGEKSFQQRLLGRQDITEDPFMPVLIQTMISEPMNGHPNPAQVTRSGVMYSRQNEV